MDALRGKVLLLTQDSAFATSAVAAFDGENAGTGLLSWEQRADDGIRKLLDDHTFTLVVVDHVLLDRTGLDTVKEMRSRSISLPIVFLRADDHHPAMSELMKLDVDECVLRRDVDPGTLPNRARQLLDRIETRKRAAALLKDRLIDLRRDEAIAELIVTICHEFNNPLAAIRICTDILSRQPLKDGERAALQQIEKNVRLIERQINTLRDSNTKA